MERHYQSAASIAWCARVRSFLLVCTRVGADVLLACPYRFWLKARANSQANIWIGIARAVLGTTTSLYDC